MIDTSIPTDMLSMWISTGLMLFFFAFGYVMSQMKASPCPWEPDHGEYRATPRDFEHDARTQWKDHKPAWAPTLPAKR